MKDTRGREAESPAQIPGRGWKDVLLRVKEQVGTDNISIVAAGVAFYFFLALFPTLAAAISIYGLITEPADVERQMGELTAFLPRDTHQMLTERLHSIVQSSDSTLGWGMLLSVLLSLWSANSGTKSLFQGINIAYDEESKRGFFKLNAITLLFTLCGIIAGIISLALVVVFPAVIDRLGFPEFIKTILGLIRWVLLGIIIMFGLAIIYKIAPDRNNPKFKWVSWGSAIATILWLLGSLLFSLYVNNFGNYNETYGPVAAVIILMLWFNLTSFIILLGAEINSELEHQTAKDTTVGRPKPLGERQAYHADHVAGENDDR